MKELTFENFKEITPRKPLIVEIGENNNFFIEISLTDHTFNYCIDMFYDHRLQTPCNRIHTGKEIHRFASILLKIYQFIDKIEDCK